MNAIETPSTEDGGDDGTCGPRIVETQVSAACVSIDGHFRDERDANSGGNHSEKAAELVALKSDVWCNARLGTGGEAEVAKAVSVAQHDERFASEVLERDGAGSGVGVILRHHGEQRFGADGEQFQIFVA